MARLLRYTERLFSKATPDQAVKIQQAALRAGLTVSEYIRNQALTPMSPGKFTVSALDALRDIGRRIKSTHTENDRDGLRLALGDLSGMLAHLREKISSGAP